MTAVSDAIVAQVRRMRQRGAGRDAEMARIDQVRDGQIHDLMPDAFSDELPRSVAANFIDTAARDISELISPLPTLEFNDEAFTSKSKKDFASKKTNIGYGYWFQSNLQVQMATGSDRYLSYGFLPFLVEADYDIGAPRLYAVDPRGCYYTLDRLGRTTSFAQVFKRNGEELAQMFPDYRVQILAPKTDMYGQKVSAADTDVEIVRFFDKDRTLCFLPARGNLILDVTPQPLGKCPIVVAERPGNNGPRGQFNDAIEVQLARAMMARMSLDAAYKSVNAPLAVPDDVPEIALGPDAVIRSRTPEKIHRVGMEMSPAAFQSEQTLEQELRLGTRYPSARSGEVQGSIVTGRGQEALQGTIDTQIKTAQLVFADALAKATSLLYELDEKVWPNRSRKFFATIGGVSLTETYTPSKDIKGDFRVDCVYGFAAGLGVAQAVVMILQMQNAGLISRADARRQLPLGLDANKLERDVAVQQVRDGLMQGVTGMAQSANVLFEQGGDPSTLLTKVASMIGAMEQGTSIEDAYTAAFPPPPPTPPDQQSPGGPGQPGQPPAPGGDGAPPGLSDTTGLPMGTAAAGQAPGGRASMQSMLAGLTSGGKANLTDSIVRRTPSLG